MWFSCVIVVQKCAFTTSVFIFDQFSLLGSVPAYYREVYEAIRCRTDERVQVEVFQRLLQKTELSKAVIGQVRFSSHCTVFIKRASLTTLG